MDARNDPLPIGPTAIDGASAQRQRRHDQNRQGGGGPPMEPAMQLALDASFGSVERWRDEFVALVQALGGGPGRVQLVFQPRLGTLVNQQATGRAQTIADGVPIVALDSVEHADDANRGAAAGADVEAFVNDIDWARVYQLYQQAVSAASEPYAASPDDVAGSVLLDVRRAGVFKQAATMIPGARWCDPAAVGTWAAEVPTDREVVVYCVYGHEVGRATALRLRAAGVQARYLHGGIDGWLAAGRPRDAKAAAS